MQFSFGLLAATGAGLAAQEPSSAAIRCTKLIAIGDPLPSSDHPDAVLAGWMRTLPNGPARSSRAGHVLFAGSRMVSQRGRLVVSRDLAAGLWCVGPRGAELIALLQRPLTNDPSLQLAEIKPTVVVGPGGHVAFAASVLPVVKPGQRPVDLRARAWGTWLWTPGEGLTRVIAGGDPAPGLAGYEFIDASTGIHELDATGGLIARMTAVFQAKSQPWLDTWAYRKGAWQLLRGGQPQQPGQPAFGMWFCVTAQGIVLLHGDGQLWRGSVDKLERVRVDGPGFDPLPEVNLGAVRLAESGRIVLAMGDRVFLETASGFVEALRTGVDTPEVGAGFVLASLMNGFALAMGEGHALVAGVCSGIDPDTKAPVGRTAIWIVGPQERELVACSGDHAPGTPHVFGQLGVESDNVDGGSGIVYGNSRGDVLFKAALEPRSLTAEPIARHIDRLGLWLYRGGNLHLLARNGNAIEVEPGKPRTLRAWQLVQPHPLSEDGRVLVLAEWDPEPGDPPQSRFLLGKGRCAGVLALSLAGGTAGKRRVTARAAPSPARGDAAASPTDADSGGWPQWAKGKDHDALVRALQARAQAHVERGEVLEADRFASKLQWVARVGAAWTQLASQLARRDEAAKRLAEATEVGAEQSIRQSTDEIAFLDAAIAKSRSESPIELLAAGRLPVAGFLPLGTGWLTLFAGPDCTDEQARTGPIGALANFPEQVLSARRTYAMPEDARRALDQHLTEAKAVRTLLEKGDLTAARKEMERIWSWVLEAGGKLGR